jgi:hypothetical protein
VVEATSHYSVIIPDPFLEMLGIKSNTPSLISRLEAQNLIAPIGIHHKHGHHMPRLANSFCPVDQRISLEATLTLVNPH